MGNVPDVKKGSKQVLVGHCRRVAGAAPGSSFGRSLPDGSLGRNWVRCLVFGLQIVAVIASVL